ncbi:piggyBac transposable element-derived protein 4-like [Pecten maximus]|uniref:piggyBac transposable element-derived protein 4-like n=1 Tax=Pecten maximus TaxID=6579 RepID=UPI001458CA1B|nr:piggyBac transposable element-derived protein 4-like [Pecten maximus]
MIIFPDHDIAAETNRYASEKQTEKPDGNWRPTNAREIRAFLGFQVVMGIVSAPTQDMYWTRDSLFRPTTISERITRQRFEDLARYFHVCDNSTNPPRGQEGHDKLSHVRSVMTKITTNLRDGYKPHRDVSIDEAMIGYTGRLAFKQYVPMKPTKRGIKVWMRADPNNGYVNEFQVYTGRRGPDPEHGLGERVVWDLTRHIAGQNHHVLCDNYFTSVNLFERLLAKNTYACGTVRVNRKGLPKEVTTAKLKIQGDMVQRQKGNLVATAWRDKRTVDVLGTNSDPQTTTTVTRKQKSGQLKDVRVSGRHKKLHGKHEWRRSR